LSGQVINALSNTTLLLAQLHQHQKHRGAITSLYIGDPDSHKANVDQNAWREREVSTSISDPLRRFTAIAQIAIGTVARRVE